MSHTNATSNYNLPQFLGSDKPAWLGDINPAMSAIDTQMKANADASTTAGTNATTALNGIGTLANLTTTEKSNLVGAVNEVDTNITTVSGVASGASQTATSAKNKADGIEAFLNINNFTTPTPTTTNGTITNYNLGCASNADGSLGKIYGSITASPTSNTSTTISFATPLRPSEAISVNGIATIQDQSANATNSHVLMLTINIATNGTASMTFSQAWYNKVVYINISACLIFAKNFGDVESN